MSTPKWAMKDALAPQEREGKLPVWAQDLIKDLRTIAQEQTELAARVVDGTRSAETDTLAWDYDAPEKFYGLRRGATVRFIPTDSGYVEVQVRGNYVHVRGSDSLDILPLVSNAVAIRALTPGERRGTL